MKTLVPAFLLLCSTFTAFSQQTKTAIDGLTVVNTPSGMAAQLTWKKGAENVSYFIVERSTDGIDFTQCGIVFTSENPDFVDYKFREKINSVSQGLVYRIAVVNAQKRVTYLPAKTLIAPETL